MERPLLLQDVEHVVVPAVLADQAGEPLGCRTRPGGRDPAHVSPIEGDRIGSGHHCWPLRQAVVDDQGLTVTREPELGPERSRQRRQQKPARAPTTSTTFFPRA